MGRARTSSTVVIGVDPHKRLNAVVVLDEAEIVLARETFPHSTEGFRLLMRTQVASIWEPERRVIVGRGGRT